MIYHFWQSKLEMEQKTHIFVISSLKKLGKFSSISLDNFNKHKYFIYEESNTYFNLLCKFGVITIVSQ